MNTPHHHMPDLFDQLGLDSDEKAIRRFIRSHRPIAADSRLADAPFWNDAQAAFLRQQLHADSDWSTLIDSLSASLREHPDPAELPQADDDPTPAAAAPARRQPVRSA